MALPTYEDVMLPVLQILEASGPVIAGNYLLR